MLQDYICMAKYLVQKGELDPNDDKVMDEIYDGIAEVYVKIFGNSARTTITMQIQKAFESELLK